MSELQGYMLMAFAQAVLSIAIFVVLKRTGKIKT
jgi:hypothetical protein